jgi:hypothetical protein
LVHEILRTEDRLKVTPSALNTYPEIKEIYCAFELGFPFNDRFKHEDSVRRTFHRLSFNHVVIKEGRELLDRFSFKNKGVFVLFGLPNKRLPVVLHLVKESDITMFLES